MENRHRYRLALSATQAHWHWSQGQADYKLSVDLPAGTAQTDWVHLAWTCDGNTAVTYLNGQAVESSPSAGGTVGSARNSGYSLRIGGKFTVGAERNAPTFNGWMDDLRIYHRTLEAKEIEALAKPSRLSGVRCVLRKGARERGIGACFKASPVFAGITGASMPAKSRPLWNRNYGFILRL